MRLASSGWSSAQSFALASISSCNIQIMYVCEYRGVCVMACMYVCMHVCMYEYQCTLSHCHPCLHEKVECMHACVYECMYVYEQCVYQYVLMHVFTYLHGFFPMKIRSPQSRMCICTYVHRIKGKNMLHAVIVV
jgi:hypothetical protein